MVEKWKPIPEFDGYEASNAGRIRSVGRWMAHHRYPSKLMWWKEKILKPGSQMSGHLFVTLPPQRAYRVHRLVALTWIGPPPFDGAMVLHRDDDPSNNNYANLKWGTQRENMADAKRNGRKLGGHRPRGSTFPKTLRVVLQ